MTTILKCFMCTEKIPGIDSRNNRNSEQNSFRLFCEILEVPQYGNSDKKSEIGYCHRCEERMLNIRNMFEQLENLEKKILDEKHLMELQLKESVHNYHKNQPENSSEKLKADIVTELNSTTIESMLEKIRKNQVGRKMRSHRRVSIMQGVTIPKLVTSKKPTQECAKNMELIGTSVTSVYDGDQEHISQGSQDGQNSQQRFVGENEGIEAETRDTVNETIKQESLNSWNFCNIPESDVKLETVIVEYPTVYHEPLEDTVPPLGFGLQTDPIDDHSEETPNVGSQFVEANFLFQHVPQGPEVNRTLLCGICGTCFDNFDQFSNHECSHMNSKNSHTAAVVIDGTTGTQKWSKKKTPYHKRPRKCDECGKILYSMKTLKNHVLSFHRGQSKFKCTICDHGSMSAKDLMTHMTKHSSARNFKCHLCEKTFKHKSTCDRHIRTHDSRENVEVLQP